MCLSLVAVSEGYSSLLYPGFSLQWLLLLQNTSSVGFPVGASGEEPSCQCGGCKRPGFSPWVRKIPWRRAWQPTPVLLPGDSPWTEEPGRLQSIGNQTWLKEFNTHACICTGSRHAGFGSYSTRAPECWLSNCGPRA